MPSNRALIYTDSKHLFQQIQNLGLQISAEKTSLCNIDRAYLKLWKYLHTSSLHFSNTSTLFNGTKLFMLWVLFFFFSFLFFPRMYVHLKRFPFLILIAYKQLRSALPFQNWSCLQKISFTTRNLWGLGALYSSHIELSPAFFFNWITLIMGCYETLRLFFHFRIRKQVPLPT